MYCTQCGSSISVDANFCAHCGHELASTDTPEAPEVLDAPESHEVPQILETPEVLEATSSGQTKRSGMSTTVFWTIVAFLLIGQIVFSTNFAPGPQGDFLTRSFLKVAIALGIGHLLGRVASNSKNPDAKFTDARKWTLGIAVFLLISVAMQDLREG